ncbi:hypothetical protein GCM10028813_04320 [Ramlibacter alkalitolerans]
MSAAPRLPVPAASLPVTVASLPVTVASLSVTVASLSVTVASLSVTPAKAGAQSFQNPRPRAGGTRGPWEPWIPAFAGMTSCAAPGRIRAPEALDSRLRGNDALPYLLNFPSTPMIDSSEYSIPVWSSGA